MKSYFFYILLTCLIAGCGKSGGSSTPVQEDPIAFTIDIDPGQTSIYAVLGSTQDAKINITSKLPVAGVTIDVLVKKDIDNSVLLSNSLQSTLTPVIVTINNLISGSVYSVTFTITSKSTATNNASKTFKIARK